MKTCDLKLDELAYSNSEPCIHLSLIKLKIKESACEGRRIPSSLVMYENIRQITWD